MLAIVTIGFPRPCESVVPFQVFVEPCHSAPDRVDLVLTFFEPVPLVRVVMRIHGLPIFLQHRDNLLCFLFGYAWIIVALQYEERRPDIVYISDRGSRIVSRAVFHRITQQALLILLQHWIGM